MRTLTTTLGLLSLIVGLAGCARAGFAPSADGANIEGGPGLDAAHDAPGSDTALDAEVDAPATPPALTCSAPQVVGNLPPTWRPMSPAERHDGLELVVRACEGGTCAYFLAQRATQTDAFGDWVEQPWGFIYTRTDPTFFDFQGETRQIYTTGPSGARELIYCATMATDPCDPLQLTGPATLTNVDGPSVVQTPRGWRMAFNDGDDANQPLAIYIAEPQGADLIAWNYRPAAINKLPNPPGDPTLSADGKLLVFESHPGPDDGDLWVAFWNATARVYDRALPLSALNTPSNDLEPEIVVLTAKEGHYELFFRSDRNAGVTEIFQTTCSLSGL